MDGKENLRATLYGKEDLRMIKCEIPQPKGHEVIVELKACGLCGTDISILRHGSSGDLLVTPENPFYLGHECSGMVASVGKDVDNLKVGDRVALELGVPCRTCELCKRGQSQLCKGYSQGGFARYICHPDDLCHKLPASLSYEEGALLEPLAVSVHACARAGVAQGCHVVICGAGTIGLTTLLTAKSMGAGCVLLTDISEERLALAKRMGADHTVLVQKGDSNQAIIQKIISGSGRRADCTIECSGVESSLQVAAHVTATGGVLVLVALEPDMARMPLLDTCVRREVDIRGSFSYWGQDYPKAIAMLSTGSVDVTPLVSHRFPLTKTKEACELVCMGEPGVMKVMVQCDAE